MLNKVILIGRLTRDPELRYTPNGISVATFTLAVDRNYTNQEGQRETDFIPIVTWRGLADTCGKYLSKGRLVAVSGRMQVRNYEGQDGQRRYITEVVASEVQFLERVGSLPDKEADAAYIPDDDMKFRPIDDDDDELPF